MGRSFSIDLPNMADFAIMRNPKIVEEMCNYTSVAEKETDFDSKKYILNFLQDLKNIFVHLMLPNLYLFLHELCYQST